MDSLERRRSRQEPRGRASGDQERLVPDALASGELDLTRRGVERGGHRAEAQIEVEGVVVGRRTQHHLLDVGGPGHQLFGERGSVVGEMLLGSDEDDAAVVTVLTQRFDCP